MVFKDERTAGQGKKGKTNVLFSQMNSKFAYFSSHNLLPFLSFGHILFLCIICHICHGLIIIIDVVMDYH